MVRIGGWLLFCLFFLFCTVPSFALSPIPGAADSQTTLETQARDRVERESLELPKAEDPPLSGLEFVHSPPYTGADESWVRTDDVGSNPQESAVFWQNTVQLTPQWLSTETTLTPDTALDCGTGLYASQSFTGREWDEETGLYFYRARYYDPATGRFLQEDPVDFAGGGRTNLYGYVENNPLSYVDPYGLDRLIFTGYSLVWLNDAGFQVRSATEKGYWPAHSGAVPFDPSRQGELYVGPVREGYYTVDPGQIETALFTPDYGSVGAWGPARVRLNEKFLTKLKRKLTTKRTGAFYIHGGLSPGTAGCIEIAQYAERQKELWRFMRWLRAYGKPIELQVVYGR